MNQVQAIPKDRLPAVPEDSDALLTVIMRAAENPNFNVDTLERLVAMRERMEERRAAQEFADAMVEVQKKIKPVFANAKNDQTRSRYATYEALDDSARPIYTEHGFSISFGTGEAPKPDTVRVTAELIHTGGQTKAYHVDMPADGKGAKGGDVMTKTHATGSALSYGKRYLLILMFNIPITDRADDDGNRAGQTGFITAQQKDLLIQLMRETGADTAKFLEYMRVPSVDEIPASAYRKAENALLAKKKQGARK